MAIIIVPTMAAFEKDLVTNLRLLEELVEPTGHEFGLEVIGKPDHFLNPEQRAQMVANLKKHAAGLTLVSHQWSGNVIYDSSPENAAFADIRTERGKRVLESGVSFAEEAIAAGVPKGNRVYVHTHSGDLYFGEVMPYEVRMSSIQRVRKNLIGASVGHPYVKVGLENLPTFPNSDDPTLINTPEKVGRSVFQTLQDYKTAVRDTDLGITFDPAHYVYDLDGSIDLVEAVDIFGEHLVHLHINDSKGDWIPGQSIVQDAIVPGEGKIGASEYKRFFRHLNDHYDLSKIGVEAEVRDADYVTLPNRREAVRRIIDWLN